MATPAAILADQETVRYGSCWEDAEVLLKAMGDIEGRTAVSVCSAGDNTLALLSAHPARLIAVDASRAQLDCLRFRLFLLRTLDLQEARVLMGAVPAKRADRSHLLSTLLGRVPLELDGWVHRHADGIAEHGAGEIGRLERYFRIFRKAILPLTAGQAGVRRILEAGTPERREEAYRSHWDTWRWRLLFRLFFGRRTMSALGREPSFFDHATEDPGDRLLAAARRALVEHDPASNPYLRRILTGTHGPGAMPVWLTVEGWENARAGAGRVVLRHEGLGDLLNGLLSEGQGIAGWNLSDLFEYMPEELHSDMLSSIALASERGARLVYWNMAVVRKRPEHLADRLHPLSMLAESLKAEDHCFFYRDLRIEEVSR
jgi:S-adenosylmethionine-diacylglycerol 3-amino-3-carboxypropyl transferase